MKKSLHLQPKFMSLLLGTVFTFYSCSGLSRESSKETKNIGDETYIVQSHPVTRPFPQEIDFKGMNKPSLSQETLNKQTLKFYQNWVNTYIEPYSFTNGIENGEGQGYIIKAETNPPILINGRETISQSEAHGWAMKVMVLMAGQEENSKEIFDGMYRVYRNWPCKDHRDLMSWALPKDGDFSADKLASATDGDMDIAYALLLANDQWGGGPEGSDISYYDAAVRIIEALEENNILRAPENKPNAPHFPRLGIGDNDEHQGYIHAKSTRSSDFMLSHIKLFDEVRSNHKYKKAYDGIWKEVLDVMFEITNEIQNPNTGLMPDFMGNENNDFSTPITTFKGISDEGAKIQVMSTPTVAEWNGDIKHQNNTSSIQQDLEIWLVSENPNAYAKLEFRTGNNKEVLKIQNNELKSVPAALPHDTKDIWLKDISEDSEVHIKFLDSGYYDDTYWYNSCRFPWRFAQGFIHDGLAQGQNNVNKITNWLMENFEPSDFEVFKTPWGGSNNNIFPYGYSLDGEENYLPFPWSWNEHSFISPFMVAFTVDESQSTQAYLDTAWDAVKNFDMGNNGDGSGKYYPNTITMLNLLLVSGNWWKPSSVPNIN